MLLLNISDIHFDRRKTNTDTDEAFRTFLEADLKEMVKKLGKVETILVGGDIAFAGLKEEYEVAFDWIEKLASSSGCSIDRIYVVPGNHDVDRLVAKTMSVKACQYLLRSARSAAEKESVLRGMFNDSTMGDTMFKPLAAYNEFAAKFDCQLYKVDKLFWQTNKMPKDDLVLDSENGIKLRIYGLNSTILSGFEGNNDGRMELYLSPLQTILNPEDGVVNAVLCHHPPDWCLDKDALDIAFTSKASLQFFGHKHSQRTTATDEYIRFSAGAVGPDPYEPGWEPGYNLVELTTTIDGDFAFLNVRVHIRVWQTSPDRFRAKTKSVLGKEVDVFEYRLPVRWSPDLRKEQTDETMEEAPINESVISPPVAVMVKESISGANTENIVYRFWKLDQSDRREIALELGLISEEEILLPEIERYGKAFLRAKEREILGNLAKAIQERETP